ncbi:MAG: methylated-DNA-[protein]-cysteine S-methyltransferase [Gaiellaceae bacterium]|jgi:methylated-DNA-[protein]-cysteine S-methyltransferase|nr:methylated-DNA-[protein]-cysteine S-methyltransferase [Gaiellaceae bacterium]
MISDALDARLRAAAAAEGLLDAAFDVMDSPIGPLLLAATPQGLCQINFRPDPEEALERLARLYGPRVLRSSEPLRGAQRELDAYFEGKRRAFDLPLDVRGSGFTGRVLVELGRVPYGEVVSYGELARRAGNPKAARAVGMTMNRNVLPIVLPCHRVVGANGSLVGYAGGLDTKRFLLELEGSLPQSIKL